MVTKRYPHHATLHYVAPGTFNTVGVWTEGTLTTIGFVCKIEPNNAARVIIGSGGQIINYNWFISTQPNSGFASVPKGAELDFFNAEHVLLRLFEYQHHVELKC